MSRAWRRARRADHSASVRGRSRSVISGTIRSPSRCSFSMAVANADQRLRQGGEGPVEIRGVGLGDQFFELGEHDIGAGDADKRVDQERPFADMPAKRDAGLERPDRVIIFFLGDFHAEL